MNNLTRNPQSGPNPRPPTPKWTRHLGSLLATTLIFVSGTTFVSLLDAFH
jgi:hypothetical protein